MGSAKEEIKTAVQKTINQLSEALVNQMPPQLPHAFQKIRS